MISYLNSIVMYCLETTNIFLIFKILLHCIETVHVRIADMEELEGLFDSSDDASDPSDDGKEQSQFPALNADVLRQIAMSLKPADVYSLSLTCKQFEENGKLMLGTLMKAQLDRVMLDRTARYTLAGTLRSFTFEDMFPRDAQSRAHDYDGDGRPQVKTDVTFDVTLHFRII